jgi:hypothetical protein
VLVGSAPVDKSIGSIYVIASQLRWITNTSPLYEFAAINSIII